MYQFQKSFRTFSVITATVDVTMNATIKTMKEMRITAPQLRCRKLKVISIHRCVSCCCYNVVMMENVWSVFEIQMWQQQLAVLVQEKQVIPFDKMSSFSEEKPSCTQQQTQIQKSFSYLLTVQGAERFKARGSFIYCI